MHCHEIALKCLYFYWLHAGSSLILVGYMSLGEHYHVSPVNICWLRHSTSARLDISILLPHIYSFI